MRDLYNFERLTKSFFTNRRNIFNFVFTRNPLAQMEEEKKEHGNKMKKMEAEMEQVFEMKVKEKMSKLQDLEADVRELNV